MQVDDVCVQPAEGDSKVLVTATREDGHPFAQVRTRSRVSTDECVPPQSLYEKTHHGYWTVRPLQLIRVQRILQFDKEWTYSFCLLDYHTAWLSLLKYHLAMNCPIQHTERGAIQATGNTHVIGPGFSGIRQDILLCSFAFGRAKMHVYTCRPQICWFWRAPRMRCQAASWELLRRATCYVTAAWWLMQPSGPMTQTFMPLALLPNFHAGDV